MNWTYGYDYFKEYMEKDALENIMVHTNLLIPGANFNARPKMDIRSITYYYFRS
ncbi:hypothetical protein KHA80_18835 [Anaerobacillus sp. HL2]|nr:hypothetical protein KHA80_18835 [Anaerobacillus sp. HL2]